LSIRQFETVIFNKEDHIRFRYNGNRKEMGWSFFNPSLKLPFLRGADFCYKSSVFRLPKKFGFDFHIFIWPDDFYRKSSTPEACLG